MLLMLLLLLHQNFKTPSNIRPMRSNFIFFLLIFINFTPICSSSLKLNIPESSASISASTLFILPYFSGVEKRCIPGPHEQSFLDEINRKMQKIKAQDTLFQQQLVVKGLKEIEGEDYDFKKRRIDQTLCQYRAMKSPRIATIVLLDDQLDEKFIATLDPELKDTYENMKQRLKTEQQSNAMCTAEQPALSPTDFKDIAEMLSRPSPLPK